MHQPIQDHLEQYLEDPAHRSIPRSFRSHLESCSPCATELRALSQQAALLRKLRAPAAEPAPGFYGKVMLLIEEQTPDSFWSAFVGPMFGRGFALTSAALVLLMGAYIVSTEPGASFGAAPYGIAATEGPSFEDGSARPQQRDAVLVTLASYRD